MTFEGREVNELHKDENLRARNFTVFKDRYGFVPKIGLDEDDHYRVGMAKSGDAVVYIKDALTASEIRLNSLYNPEYETGKWADKFEVVNRRTTVALLGFSNGSFLRALTKRFRPDTTFFVYEPDEALFSFVCSYIDIADIISENRIKLYVSDGQYDVFAKELISDITTARPETLKVVTPYYSANDDFDAACMAVGRIMRSNTAFMRGRSRICLRARLYAWNRMRFAHFLPDLAGSLPEGIPAVIVAAGPSLRKNVHLLKQLKDHALIICTDRAASVLDEYGIVPDIVSSFDAEKNPDFLSYRVLDGVPLLCSYQVNIETQKLYRDRMIFMHALSYENSLFEGNVGTRDKGVDLGGNVAGGSFVACEMLGIKTIILMGQDLAYLDGKHHADERTDGTPTESIRETEGIDGGTVFTTDSWLTFKSFYENRILQSPDLRVIDATEGGALIKGTEVMTLQKVIDDVCKQKFELSDLLTRLRKAQDYDGYLRTVTKLKEWSEDLKMISDNAKKLSEICEQLLKECRYNDITNPKLYKKFREIERLINEFLPTQAYKMLKEFWIEDMYSIPDNNFVVRTNEEALPVFENALGFYSKLPEDCESLRTEIERSIEEGRTDNEALSR